MRDLYMIRMSPRLKDDSMGREVAANLECYSQ